LKTRFAEQRLDLTVAEAAGSRCSARPPRYRRSSSYPAARVVGVATDGTAAHVRAVLDELDPRHRAISRFEVRGATLDDVFLALTGHPTPKETANV
jgi:ABC-2 type transport system ATP-binding protein